MLSLNHYMNQAVHLAHQNKTPFAALLLEKSTGAIIMQPNTVARHGKTAHAEMNVIRKMEETQEFTDPADLILFSTAEPCPMCMGAIIWSQIGEVYYGVSLEEVANYKKQIFLPAREIALQAWYDIQLRPGLCYEECKDLFDLYSELLID